MYLLRPPQREVTTVYIWAVGFSLAAAHLDSTVKVVNVAYRHVSVRLHVRMYQCQKSHQECSGMFGGFRICWLLKCLRQSTAVHVSPYVRQREECELIHHVFHMLYSHPFAVHSSPWCGWECGTGLRRWGSAGHSAVSTSRGYVASEHCSSAYGHCWHWPWLLASVSPTMTPTMMKFSFTYQTWQKTR